MKISKWSYFLFATILLLGSCNTNNESKSESDKISEAQMEELLQLYEAKEYQQFIEKAEIEINKSQDDFGLLIGLSVAYNEIGNYEKAFFYARKQLQIVPDDYYALFVIGNLHDAIENLDSAEIYYNRVIELQPTYAKAYVNLAKNYELQGKKQDAINNYIDAAGLFDFNNDKEEVITISNKVLELDPTNKQAKNFLERFHIKAQKEQ